MTWNKHIKENEEKEQNEEEMKEGEEKVSLKRGEKDETRV